MPAALGAEIRYSLTLPHSTFGTEYSVSQQIAVRSSSPQLQSAAQSHMHPVATGVVHGHRSVVRNNSAEQTKPRWKRREDSAVADWIWRNASCKSCAGAARRAAAPSHKTRDTGPRGIKHAARRSPVIRLAHPACWIEMDFLVLWEVSQAMHCQREGERHCGGTSSGQKQTVPLNGLAAIWRGPGMR